MEVHNIDPVWDKNSKILILGSFPSVKSREVKFFYGHPQNRFWRVLSSLTGSPVPESTDDKKRLLLDKCIALWDVISSCEITGSSDSSIKNAVPNDLTPIIRGSDIKQIFTNGGTADRLYKKYCLESVKIPSIKLPSTSPANAAYSLERLKDEWKIILSCLG